jgi:hypothetical protein
VGFGVMREQLGFMAVDDSVILLYFLKGKNNKRQFGVRQHEKRSWAH